MLDAGVDAASLAQALWAHLTVSGKTNEQITRKFALSDGDAYNHHVLLRAFVTHPEVFKAEITVYLAERDQWQIQDSHPWQWISAYRAWLLVMQGQKQQSTHYFNQAIDLCADKGITMHWIGCVISMMGHKLGLKVTQKYLQNDYLEALQAKLPNAPFGQLQAWNEDKSPVTQTSILQELSACTPFNFH